jgi:hypothetical protein
LNFCVGRQASGWFLREPDSWRKQMDGIPLDCITLPEAVAARADIISDYELQREFGDYEAWGEYWQTPAVRPYLRRELSISELFRALIDGSIQAYVRDPRSAEILRLPHGEWRTHSFWWQTICGGEIRATAGERLSSFNGKIVLLTRAALELWIKQAKAKRRKPASTKVDYQVWLEKLMRASPHQRPKAKQKLREANQAVPEATWRNPGAPKKS